MILFLQLLLAHLVGDFFLQPTAWVRQKEEKTWTSPLLYLHVGIHFVLILLIRFDLRFWLPALVIAFSHLIIDLVKINYQRTETRRYWFFADQGMHLSVLILASWLLSPGSADLRFLQEPRFLIVIAALCFLLQPAAVIIRMAISHWAPVSVPDEKSLQNAGKLIGMLERLLIFIFIMAGKWEGVGFLLGAKSIFRFGDLKGSTDRKLTEYILIGTLISFSIAIVTAMLAHYYFEQFSAK
ncbi:MAG TPA: DUF3307 domain-containing protein [Flavitalea sp.]|nr:DUF3307 domain-containing protein [Flavitalea sp.]